MAYEGIRNFDEESVLANVDPQYPLLALGEPQKPGRALPQVAAVNWMHRAKVCSLCCAGCLVFLFVAIVIVGGWAVTAMKFNRMFEQDKNMNPSQFPRMNSCVGCPDGYKNDSALAACLQPCVNPQFVMDWEEQAKDTPWKLVHFPSRTGPRGEPPVNVSAWWLPPPKRAGVDPNKAPRIIAMHGAGANNNHCGAQTACFLLRQIGFGCLLPSARDYGLSGPSSHPSCATWAYDIAYDILGAWDFAVNDPDGVLGGPLPDSRVGIMGFSKGTNEAAIALPLEPRVPGAWLDSGPYNGYINSMILYVTSLVPGILGVVVSKLLAVPVYYSTYWLWSRGMVDYYDTKQLLARQCRAGTRRHVLLSWGVYDTLVSPAESEAMYEVLRKNSDCYNFVQYKHQTYCNGANHHVEMWEFPADTRQRLCNFWSETFQSDPRTCNLTSLRSYQLWSAPEHLPPGTPVLNPEL